MNKELLGALAGALVERKGGVTERRATLKKFESEADFIAHARKIIALTPRDVVTVEGEGMCVYAGDDGGRARVFYLDDDKEMHAMASPYGAIMEINPA